MAARSRGGTDYHIDSKSLIELSRHTYSPIEPELRARGPLPMVSCGIGPALDGIPRLGRPLCPDTPPRVPNLFAQQPCDSRAGNRRARSRYFVGSPGVDSCAHRYERPRANEFSEIPSELPNRPDPSSAAAPAGFQSMNHVGQTCLHAEEPCAIHVLVVRQKDTSEAMVVPTGQVECNPLIELG